MSNTTKAKQPTEPITLQISTREARTADHIYMCLMDLRRVLGLPTLSGGYYTVTVYPNPDGILHYSPYSGVVQNQESQWRGVLWFSAWRDVNRALGLRPTDPGFYADIEIEGDFNE